MADEHAGEEKHSKGHGGGHGGHGGGHGGGEHEEGGAPEWLISFADNVALLMGFFVILLAMNMGPKATGASEGESTGDSQQTQEMLDWAIGVREAFNNPVSAENPRDALLYRRKMEKEAENSNVRAPRGKETDVTNIREGPYKSRGGLVTFATGSVEIDAEARAAIREIVLHRRGLNNIIEVIGNVSAAEAFDLPDRGMDLSYQRARTVVNALVEAGVLREHIQIKAMADTDRVAGKIYDKHGHRANQRVEIIETTRISAPVEGDSGRTSETAPGSAPAPKADSPAPASGAGHGGH